MAGPAKERLSDSTIVSVLGVLAARSGSKTNMPAPPKAEEKKNEGTPTTKVPETSSDVTSKGGKKKKKAPKEEKVCPSGPAGSDGKVPPETEGKPIYTWVEFQQLKVDFQLSDAEAYQVLHDLCGPPPPELQIAKPPETAEPTPPKGTPKPKKSRKAEENPNVADAKAAAPPKKSKRLRAAEFVEDPVPEDRPEEKPVEEPAVPQKRRRGKSSPNEAPQLVKGFVFDSGFTKRKAVTFTNLVTQSSSCIGNSSLYTFFSGPTRGVESLIMQSSPQMESPTGQPEAVHPAQWIVLVSW